jgi:Uncharacterized protein conserved in bacteria
MKNLNILFLIILTLPLNSYFIDNFDKNHTDDILGEWHTQSRDSIIKIYRDGGNYSGKVVWTKNPTDENGQPRKDLLNPDPAKRDNHFVGTVIMKGFTFDNEDLWENGELYDLTHGKTYRAQITLKDANTLKMRGYLGTPMIGKTVTWKRKGSI